MQGKECKKSSEHGLFLISVRLFWGCACRRVRACGIGVLGLRSPLAHGSALTARRDNFAFQCSPTLTLLKGFSLNWISCGKKGCSKVKHGDVEALIFVVNPEVTLFVFPHSTFTFQIVLFGQKSDFQGVLLTPGNALLVSETPDLASNHYEMSI